ncbi:potassium transporter KefC [Magnetovibrio blakemorei]|uniref:Potassium transporter KefC n=1 Tax=Magnetovibrio blakemorei TaxID=28181 RepID=A0A1E5Q5V1_9PROT|nr:potassium transporter KefC [Magnetovibrio blakemorei]
MNYLSDVAILLTAAVVVVPLFQSMRMGGVPGFVIAGVIVGPYGFALIGNVHEIGQLAELGVVLLLFIIGIELNPTRLLMMRRLLFGLGTLQVLCTSAVLAAVVHYGFGVPLRVAILVGPALALSSTAFVLQLLGENKMLTSEQGRASIAILLLQDLAVVPLLALVSLLTMPTFNLAGDVVIALGEAVLIVAFVIFAGRYLLQPIFHRVAQSHNSEVFTAMAVLLVLGAALLMEHVGLSMAMGAFLAGLLIADSSFRHQIIAETQPFRGLLLGLFFMSMGMTLDLNLLFSHPVLLVSLVAALIALKAVVIWPLARLFGLASKRALMVSLFLAQGGEFALVIFTVALGSGLMDEVLFQQLLLVVILSMLVTPFLAFWARQLHKSESSDQHISPIQTVKEEPLSAPILIIGFGRVGQQIGQVLELAKVSFVAIDNDPTLVAREYAKGRAVFYGDAERPGVLKALGGEKAALAIIAMNDHGVTEQLVSVLRHNFPHLAIFARGHNQQSCQRLKTLGVDVAVSETLEASIELARAALANVSTPDQDVQALIDDFRRRYHEPDPLGKT